MNEYNYNSNNTNNTINNDQMNGENMNTPKKPKKHTGAKIVASLMAMALVSAGSIGAYRAIDDRFDLSSSSSSSSDKNSSSDSSDSSSKLSAETVSIIKPEDVQNGELSTEEIVEKVLPSVVGIESTFQITSSSNSYDFSDFGGFGGFGGFNFNGGNSQPEAQDATATGTGVVISENGYVVTNAHVIYDSEYGGGEASEISVLLSNDKSYDAEIVGYDTDCDIAVLKIDAEELTAAEFGDSDSLKLGESVVAIGNPLGFELMDTVTSGIISGKNREITINDKAMNLLQTDAAINSGNSGGPLINKYGQVIGINSSKMSSSYSSQASIEGIGFAIPSNEVAKIVDDLMQYGYVTGKPQLGISCQDVTETISRMYNLPVGAYITDVTEGSAADNAGLCSGDVITKVDGEEITTTEELNAKKNEHEAGDVFELTYVRNGKEHTTKVILDEVKSDKSAKSSNSDKSDKADKADKSDKADTADSSSDSNE